MFIEKSSEEIEYLSLLPIYNPSSVFIFNIDSFLVFKNTAATREFSNITSTQCLGIVN